VTHVKAWTLLDAIHRINESTKIRLDVVGDNRMDLAYSKRLKEKVAAW
jgi:hypothetical protein